MWSADNPGFDSSLPFYAAAISGLIGCVALFLFDRAVPIREAVVSEPAEAEPGVVPGERA